VKALVYDRYGGPEVLHLADLPEPRPGPGECLVRVHAASVNPADWKIMRGQWRFASGRSFPRPIGIDFAGTVERTGRGVRGFAAGEAVMGMVNPLVRGSMAELVRVPARNLSRAPRNLSLVEAAGLPVAFATARLALRHRRRLLAGRKVLLTGAGGGVGHFALQLASRAGAQVTAVCSAGKADLCRGLGAARVLDYGQSGPLALEERFDVVLDCASSIGWPKARRLLAPRGEYLFLDTAGRLVPFLKALASQLSPGRRMWTFLVTPSGRRGRRLAELFERQALRVVIGGVYPLTDAVEAYRESLRGHAQGKLIVTPGRQ
jgi:NADPH:quinone reductase-like Zn-dependent oxidoreductase